MKLCIISGPEGDDVKQHFLEEAQKLFDTVVYAPLHELRIECGDGKTTILNKNTDLSTFDAIYPRVFVHDFLFIETLIDALEETGVYLPFSLEGYQATIHKFLSVERVARIGVPVPDSSLTITPHVALAMSKKIGFPIVLKLLRGFGGKGVMMLKSEEELRPVLDTLQVFNEFPLSQKFIPNEGHDIRALVIGDDVLGIKRQSEGTEWRANVSQGGSAELVDLDENITEMARQIATFLGMDICGVDFIETPDGPVFLEVNCTPGIFKDYFGSGLAKKMLEHIYNRVSSSSP
ncbi:MAG: RimK family alpha-L-glutamate ligase [Candidatus Woesearchaeota archaeon]|nr:RimK family alpha-L-glutamate ligase [Candidatus Woesearchaeota archaeon]